MFLCADTKFGRDVALKLYRADVFGTADAFARNAEREFERNAERYAFLRWGQNAFERFAVVPPAEVITVFNCSIT